MVVQVKKYLDEGFFPSIGDIINKTWKIFLDLFLASEHIASKGMTNKFKPNPGLKLMDQVREVMRIKTINKEESRLIVPGLFNN